MPLKAPRPLFLRSNFQDEEEFADVLGLAKAVDQNLADTATRGRDVPLVFVDARDLADA